MFCTRLFLKSQQHVTPERISYIYVYTNSGKKCQIHYNLWHSGASGKSDADEADEPDEPDEPEMESHLAEPTLGSSRLGAG